MRDKKLRKFAGYKDGAEDSYYTLDRRVSVLEATVKGLLVYLDCTVDVKEYPCGCCFDARAYGDGEGD